MRADRLRQPKRGLLAGVVWVTLLSLTGCWSGTEANELAIVNTIGVDQNEEGQVELTAVIVKPKTLYIQPQPNTMLIETAAGQNIFEAMEKLSNAVPGNMYVGHLNTIVIGEQAAREKMVPLLDFFIRMKDLRPNIDLFVTKGPARELVQTTPQLNATIGLDIQALTRTNRFAPTRMVQDISQFADALVSNTSDPYTGVIEAPQQQGIDVPHAEQAKSDESKIPAAVSLQGTAVFKEGSLIGFLDDQETRGLLALKGELDNGIAVVKCGGDGDGTVSLSIKDTKSQISPRLSGPVPEMDVNIQVKADIEDVACSNFRLNTASMDRLNQQLADVVKQNAMKAISKAKNQWQSDIFGFGKAIYRASPKQWDRMAPQWRDDLLKKTDVRVTVSANIMRHGLLKDPIKVDESR